MRKQTHSYLLPLGSTWEHNPRAVPCALRNWGHKTIALVAWSFLTNTQKSHRGSILRLCSNREKDLGCRNLMRKGKEWYRITRRGVSLKNIIYVGMKLWKNKFFNKNKSAPRTWDPGRCWSNNIIIILVKAHGPLIP